MPGGGNALHLQLITACTRRLSRIDDTNSRINLSAHRAQDFLPSFLPDYRPCYRQNVSTFSGYCPGNGDGSIDDLNLEDFFFFMENHLDLD